MNAVTPNGTPIVEREIDRLPLQPIDAMPTGGAVMATDPMTRMLEAVMMDTTIPLDRLEKVIELKERHEQTESVKAYNTAMAMCQAEMPAVTAKANNSQTKSKYATLAAIYAVAKPVASGYGLSFSTFPAPCDKADHLGVKWVLRHSGGHSEEGFAEIPKDDKGMKGTANKTQTHAFGSSNSYARRYLFCMIFDIAITSEDDDGNSGGARPVEKISEEQFIEVKDKAAQLEIAEDVICKAEGIDILADLPASRFAVVMRELNITQKKREEAKRGGEVTANMGEE